MSLYNFLDEKLFLPIGDLVNGSQVASELKRMRRNDFLSEERIVAIQNAKLQKLINHCYQTVPYYTRLFDRLGIKPEQIRSREDLKLLPVLTKQIIRDNYQDLFSTAVSDSRRHIASTGGSTGTPLTFCIDNAEWSAWKASTLRAWEWYGLHLGDKIFSLGGNSINQKKKIITLKGAYDRFIMRNHKFSSANVTDECMMEHYSNLMKIRPAAIRGYGSSLYILARFIERKQLPVCPVKAVLTTGEVLVEEYRRKLEQVFHAPVYDAYGAGDGGILSHECPSHKGLHISEEECIIEITDPLGNPIPDGEVGNVCTTDLNNFVFPFIRYQVGDMAVMKKERCDCGRHTRLIHEVMGRAGRLVYNKKGTPISPLMLWIMMYPELNYHDPSHQAVYSKIDKFQIRQDKNGDIDILLKLNDANEPHEQFNYILTNYRNHFEGSQVNLQFVDNIPTLPSGKEDYCVSEYTHQQ